MAQLPFSKKRLATRIVISYILDYVFIIGFFAGFWALNLIQPFHQHFSLDNKDLQYPYAVKERITIQEAVIISLLAPLVVIIVFTLVLDGLFSNHKPLSTDGSGRRKLRGPYRFKDRLWELNCGVLGLLLSQSMAFVITQILKNAAGRPRPDFIDRCQPVAGSQDAPVYGLSNSTICRGDPSLIKDGFRSWPSGHSSCETLFIASFAGLFWLSLYLGGKLHIMDSRGEVWKMILVVIPFVAATLVAVSRIMDARHHAFDVISGSLLGIATAWISYRQYFPPLSQPWKKGRAFPIRTWGTEPVMPPEVAYARASGQDDASVPLRDVAREQLRGTSQETPGQSAVSQGQVLPTSVGKTKTRRRHDGYSSSSSEDERVGYGVNTPGGRMGPAEASQQPYDSTTYYSAGQTDSSFHAESGTGQRHVTGEV